MDGSNQFSRPWLSGTAVPQIYILPGAAFGGRQGRPGLPIFFKLLNFALLISSILHLINVAVIYL